MILMFILGIAGGIDFSVMGGLGISHNSVEYGLTKEIDFNQSAGAPIVNIQSGYLFDSGFRLGIDFLNTLSAFEWKAESEDFQRTGSVKEGNLAVAGSYLFDAGRFRPYLGAGAGVHWGSYIYTYTADSTSLRNIDNLGQTVGLTVFCGLEVDLMQPLMVNCRLSYNHVPRTGFTGWLVEDVDYMNRVDLLIGLGVRP